MNDKPMWGLIALILLVFAIAMIGEHYERQQEEANRKDCEEKGGVYLTRTYQSGKTTSAKYTCIQKNVIIE